MGLFTLLYIMCLCVYSLNATQFVQSTVYFCVYQVYVCPKRRLLNTQRESVPFSLCTMYIVIHIPNFPIQQS